MQRTQLEHRIADHVSAIYTDLSDNARDELQAALLALVPSDPVVDPTHPWDQSTVLIIAYGDSITSDQSTPLATIHRFFNRFLAPEFTALHLLPVYPSTSDDGFSVADYSKIDPQLGDWADIQAIGKDLSLMMDLVLNHCSQSSDWFQGFLEGDPQYQPYFFIPDPEFDTSQVTRPRPQPVLQEFETRYGIKPVWCTFSRDQVDLNYRNPAVLLDMVKVVLDYVSKGAQILRLDAVAFLWKDSGSRCINLDQTHEIIRLIRTLTDAVAPNTVIVTETNLPNQENLSYFGNGNEAHWVYNFPLPPLLTYSLLSGDPQPLKRWAMSLPPALPGMTYLNFLASHDGIGLRPTEGLLSAAQFQNFSDRLIKNGGQLSYRAQPDGTQTPYEANITLFSALQRSDQDLNGRFAMARFIAAHAILFALEGVPGVYLNSMFAQPNDDDAFADSGIPRRINRTKYRLDEIEAALDQVECQAATAFNQIKRLLAVRQTQSAFHPNATQFTLQLPDPFFGIWRQSLDRRSNLFAVTNLSHEPVSLPMSSLNIVTGEVWCDLLDGSRIEESMLTLTFEPYQSRWIGRGSTVESLT